MLTPSEDVFSSPAMAASVAAEYAREDHDEREDRGFGNEEGFGGSGRGGGGSPFGAADLDKEFASFHQNFQVNITPGKQSFGLKICQTRFFVTPAK